jgi:transcriptional regulator with XRE-family HTH domain
MAAPHDRAAHRQRLAALITQRRAALGWSKETSADKAGISYTTYTRVEEGQNVQAMSYAKIEAAFALVPGSCRAVLDGAHSITLTDGTELLLGSKITPLTPDMLEAEVQQAVTNAAIGTLPETTGEKIREISDQVIEHLRKRGILPPAGE